MIEILRFCSNSDSLHTYFYTYFFILDASKFLYIHRILVQPTDKNYLNGIWGKLASEILMQNWDTALEDLKRLQQFIDESTFGSSLQLLQQRTWLIHWSLFVFFNHPKGRDLIIELFLYQKQYLNAIQTTCPWILRYLSTAVIINKNSRYNIELESKQFKRMKPNQDQNFNLKNK